MSTFNLDRFRYDKKSTTTTSKGQSCFSRSPDSEKENKPGKQMLKLPNSGGSQMWQEYCREHMLSSFFNVLVYIKLLSRPGTRILRNVANVIT